MGGGGCDKHTKTGVREWRSLPTTASLLRPLSCSSHWSSSRMSLEERGSSCCCCRYAGIKGKFVSC